MPKGMLRVRLRLNSLAEVERWVLSMGTHATVIRPEALAARICEAAVTLGDRYKALHQQEDEQLARHERAIPSSRTPSFITKGVRSARLVKAKTQS